MLMMYLWYCMYIVHLGYYIDFRYFVVIYSVRICLIILTVAENICYFMSLA